MTGMRGHPPPTAAPAAPAMAATRPGRVVGLDGIRGLAALFVVLSHIFERAWQGYPPIPLRSGRPG
jgi:peptidoglycan/LPS O-acetylase OafA/YrhL